MTPKYDIKERTFEFGVRILEICKMLPYNPEGNKVRGQLASAGTSIGANVEEADGALTKKDFVNKMGIARKESKETVYWLRIISRVFVKPELIDSDIKEGNEIKNILSSIIENTKKNKRND